MAEDIQAEDIQVVAVNDLPTAKRKYVRRGLAQDEASDGVDTDVPTVVAPASTGSTLKNLSGHDFVFSLKDRRIVIPPGGVVCITESEKSEIDCNPIFSAWINFGELCIVGRGA